MTVNLSNMKENDDDSLSVINDGDNGSLKYEFMKMTITKSFSDI